MRIAVCLELGAGLGHLCRVEPVVRLLQRNRAAITVVSPAGADSREVLGALDVELRPAPPHGPRAEQAAAPSHTYGQNLRRNGYGDEHWLADTLRRWVALLGELAPSLVVTEHAPAALLAARALDLPRAVLGTGFSLPPDEVPMPGLQPWFRVPESYLQTAEAATVADVNRGLTAAGLPPIQAVRDIFAGARRFLCTVPELDHYGPRPSERYWGVAHSSPFSARPRWPSGGRPRIFFYLGGGHRHLDGLLGELGKRRLAALGYVPGLTRPDRRALARDTVRLAAEPIDSAWAPATCDCVVTHGGSWSQAALLRGKPVLALPQQLEQAVWSYRAGAQGLATVVSILDRAPDWHRRISELTSAALRDRVAAFSGRYTQRFPHGCCGAELCAALLPKEHPAPREAPQQLDETDDDIRRNV